jgi:DNA-binding NtrC family response regulator
MLVDDDEIVRKLMKKILVHGGYQVDNFENGSAAWDVLSESPETWDLLITDQTMPEMTGVDLARKVLQVRPDMPVILCSGYSEVINGEQALEIGIRVFLQKPVTMHEMLAAAAQALSTVHEV